MSQHIFETRRGEEPIKVILGYDRPLRYFFLSIERMAPKTPRAQFIWNSHEQPTAFEFTLEALVAKLDELGVCVPEEMVNEVSLEPIFGRTQRIVRYQSSGQHEVTAL